MVGAAHPVIARTGDHTIICDEPRIAEVLRGAGWHDVRGVSVDCDSEATPVRHAILLCTNPATPLEPVLARSLLGATTLHVPLFAFDPTPAVAVYTMEMLRLSDPWAAVRRNRTVVSRFTSVETLRFVGRAGQLTHLRCTPDDDISVGTALTAALPCGVATSVGLLYEVELERDRHGHRPFRVSGVLDVDGMLFAESEDYGADAAAARAVAARVQAASAPGGLRLVIQENELVSCVTPDGRSWLAEVIEVAGGDPVLSEFAVGTNRLPHPDFSLNAQLNEGAGGIHVGLGGGPGALHLDFVALAARFASAPERAHAGAAPAR